jgi:glycosyltransferase involved in cell wall biosynthesis
MPQGAERCYTPDGVVRILCVGKLTERRKNHFLLLRALEPLASRFDFRVTIVGSSSLDIGNADPEYFKALQDYARHGLLADRTEIVPNAPFSEMPTIYRNHDICVLPSRAEPLGTAPLEAMAQGCASIVSADAGSAYYVQSAQDAGFQCGDVFPGQDVTTLAKTLEQTMDGAAPLRSLGMNALTWTRTTFHPDGFVSRFIALQPRSDREDQKKF